MRIAALCRDDTRLRFVMTGLGPLEGEIREAVRSAGLERFHMLGAVSDLQTVLPGYDVLVVPSRVDGRPLVIMEALASGVPVVASRVGGIPEMIVPGRNGALCEPGDVAAFAETLRGLAGDPDGLAKLSREARAFAERHLNEGGMVDRYERALGGV